MAANIYNFLSTLIKFGNQNIFHFCPSHSVKKSIESIQFICCINIHKNLFANEVLIYENEWYFQECKFPHTPDFICTITLMYSFNVFISLNRFSRLFLFTSDSKNFRHKTKRFHTVANAFIVKQLSGYFFLALVLSTFSLL